MLKTRLSSFDTKVLVSEISQLVRGGIISNIYQSNSTFIIKIHTQEGRKDLILEPPHRFNLTKYEYEKPTMPPNLCRALRKRLRQGRIEEVTQINDDRIISLKIRKANSVHYLVLELIREGNLILLNEDKEIEIALNPARMKDRVILPRAKYIPPPKSYIDVLRSSPEEVLEYLKNGRGELIRNMVVRLGIPSEIAEEICFRCSIDKKKEVKKVNLDDVANIVNMYHELLDEAIRERKGYIFVKNGSYINFAPIRLLHLEEKGINVEEYSSFNEAVDEFFIKVILHTKKEKGQEKIEKKKEKILREIQECRKRLDEYTRLAKRYREMADQVFARLNLVNFLLERVRNLKESYRKWKDVEGVIKKDKELASYIKGIVPSESKIILIVNGYEIPLNLMASAQENAGRFYDLSKEYERKVKRIYEVLKEKEEELKKLSKEEVVEEKPVLRRKLRWFEKFHWFITSNGHVVIGGRDFKQNELIVRRYLTDNDLFFHADIHGAPAVVLKVDEKEISGDEIYEAAQFAAAYSRAWKLGMSAIDVYWVKGNQVSKSPPPGEYLPKGAFMIRGKRNYIKNVPLVLGIGISPSDEALIIAGPPSVIRRRCNLWVELVPGNLSKSEIAKFIYKFFINNVEEEMRQILEKIRIDYIISLIPGSSLIIRKGRRGD